MLGFGRSVQLRGVSASKVDAVVLTENAKKRVQQILNSKGYGQTGAMILGVTSGKGCKGFLYHVDFAPEAPPQFIPVATRVYTPPEHLMALLGVNVDWIDGDLESKFVFENSNATSTCGCGKSFAL